VTRNEEENPGTDLYLLAAGRNHLRILPKSEYLSTPGINASASGLGECSVPLQSLDVLKAIFLTLS
jgi:hypothetical protein